MMNPFDLKVWASANVFLAVIGVLVASAGAYLIARTVIARGLFYIAARTSTRNDDIFVRHLHPYRLSWAAPLLVIYLTAYLFPVQERVLEKVSLFFLLWLLALTINSLMKAVNEIYENNPNYNGVSIEGYLDIVKLVVMGLAVILSITLITGEAPWVLLTGLGAITAILLLIFQGTILSLVASVQIVANDLIKEGDWVEVPSYGADGDVVNIGLHTIKIRNFDMTYSIIPTYKIVDVAYKNWRGMKESGGRRIQRSINVDMISVKFCDSALLTSLAKIDLIQTYIQEKIDGLQRYQREHGAHYDSPLDGPQVTNIEVFREYICAYLSSRADIHHENLPFLVRALAPNPTGLPIELYIFTRTTDWAEYETIQAEIFDHLLAAADNFDLRVFQEPTGLDFAAFSKRLNAG